VQFDNLFETFRGKANQRHALWKKKCGFTKTSTVLSIKPSAKPIEKPREGTLPMPQDDTDPSPEPIVEDVVNEPEPETFGETEGAGPTTVPTPIPSQRSPRTWKPTRRMIESLQQEGLTLLTIPISLEALHYDLFPSIEIDEIDPIALVAKND
jgi:hypothetical protein